MTPRKKAPSNGLFAARDPRAEARVLEREAASYPEERDWTLGEAAHQWRLAGEGDHAIELLQGMLADPEADSDLVRSQLVETYFALDRPDAAYEQIAEL